MHLRVEQEHAISEGIAPAEIVKKPTVKPVLPKDSLDLEHSRFVRRGFHERHLIVAVLDGQRAEQAGGLRGTMPAMTMDAISNISQFRVSLFVGPQPVKGKPFTQSTVYNVKKRSWKGGVQVAVELDQTQIDHLSATVGFSQWLEQALAQVPQEERASYHERAQELLVQALSWCKLDLLLQSGITQDNQCLTADTYVAELDKIAPNKRDFISSHVAAELDLLPHNPH
jgi:hypothetical protein